MAALRPQAQQNAHRYGKSNGGGLGVWQSRPVCVARQGNNLAEETR